LTVLYVDYIISCNVIRAELFGETEEVKCTFPLIWLLDLP